MKARIFPRKTSMTPEGKHCYYDAPGLFDPKYKEAYISTVFTWDKPRAEELKIRWEGHADKILLGGPAYDDPGGEFIPGKFLKEGVTITSRGCVKKCPFCFVPIREGNIRELEVKPGYIIQDNNFLATSKKHQERVFEMLKGQSSIEFKGGLEYRLITPEIADKLRGLRIKTLWLAADSRADLMGCLNAINILRGAGFGQKNIYVYVLIGSDMEEEEERLMCIYLAGAMPFSQLYQPEERIEYSREWKKFMRTWSRPAAYQRVIKNRVKKQGEK